MHRVQITTQEQVKNISSQLRAHNPEYPKIFKGFLYGSHCCERITVPVPLDIGMEDVVTIDDLFTECWVRRLTSHLAVVNVSRNRYTVANFPGTSHRLPHAYTIYYIDQFLVDDGKNDVITKLMKSTGSVIPWYGNILVVKHGRDYPVVNMRESDGKLVDLIVLSVIRDFDIM